jgi:6-phosphogluconolactonase
MDLTLGVLTDTNLWRKGARTVLTRASLAILILAALLALTGCFGLGGGHQTIYVTTPLNGGVAVFTISNNTGKFSQLLGSPYPTGISPTQIVLHPGGKFAYIANGGEANISLFKISSSGSLSEVMPRTPAGKNPAALVVDSTGGFLFVVNAGDNTVSSYTIDSGSGTLTPVAGVLAQTGFTPVKLAISPSGKFLYVSNSVSNTLSAYSISTGVLTSLGAPYPVGAGPNWIAIDPTGKFLYVASLTGGDFSGFTIDSTSGALTAMSGSPYAVVVSANVTPLSGVAIDLTGKFLYVSALNANKVYAYTINSTTGVPSPINSSPFAAGGGPAFISTDADGQFMFVGNQGTHDISVFRLTQSTGVLTSISTASMTSAPTSMVVVK